MMVLMKKQSQRFLVMGQNCNPSGLHRDELTEESYKAFFSQFVLWGNTSWATQQNTVNAANFYYFLFSILYHGMKFPYKFIIT